MKNLISLIALFGVITLSAQSAKLEYNLKKGDNYVIEMKMKQNMAPLLNLDLGIKMNMKTTGGSNGNIDTQYQIKSMKMDMSSQGERVTFDSNKKESELTADERKMKAEIAPALESVMHQTIDKTGKIVSLKMVPEVKGASALINQNQFLNMEYPTKSLNVGSTWDYTQNINGMNMKMIYKVTEITGDYVFADIVGSLEGASEAKIGGKVKVERSTGMISEMNVEIGVNAMGMSMGIDVEMTSKRM